VTAGARGRLAGDWNFDIYAQFGQNERIERQTNNVSLSKLQDLAFAPDGGASICSGGFNPFVVGSLSSDCARYVAVDAANAITVRQRLAEASVTGPLWSLPTGDLSAAFGVLYKRDEFEYDADEALSKMLPGVPGVIGPRPDIAGFAAAPDRSGDESNTDAYIELRVPVFKDRPGAQSLELGLGFRYSDYSQVGGVSSYKAELLYRPLSPLRLRGSYQHAVRAPSIEELYYPPVSNQFIVPVPDPCDANSSARTGPDRTQVEALCLAQGLPAALLPNYDFELRRVDGISGGNPDLKSEQGDTYSLGLAWTSTSVNRWVRDLQLSVDWYQIAIDEGIGRWDSESSVSRCFDPTYNPTFDSGNVYCSFFTRDGITGNIFAQILDRNIGGLETAGVDVQFDWGFAAGPGTLRLNALLTFVDYWTYLDPSGFAIDYAGTVGGGGLGRSVPRWKSLLNLSYEFDKLGLMARWQHIDSARDAEYRDFDVPAYDYVDFGASYVFGDGPLKGLSARAGIDNAFDRAPPIFPTWQQANTDPSLYDVLGRRFYLRLNYAFR
jgi:outer membrane receptor protein involved in Fe transport